MNIIVFIRNTHTHETKLYRKISKPQKFRNYSKYGDNDPKEMFLIQKLVKRAFPLETERFPLKKVISNRKSPSAAKMQSFKRPKSKF